MKGYILCFKWMYLQIGSVGSVDVMYLYLPSKHSHFHHQIHYTSTARFFTSRLSNTITKNIHVIFNLPFTVFYHFYQLRNPTPDASLGFTWEPSTVDNLQFLSLTPSPSMQPDNRKKVRAALKFNFQTTRLRAFQFVLKYLTMFLFFHA